MKVGNFDVRIVRDGIMKLDGGAYFGVVPRVLWERLITPDERNRVPVMLNCVLVRTGQSSILIDTGLGTKHPAKRQSTYAMEAGQLVANLHQHGVEPGEITHVIFSHLHFDHAGGATYFNGSGKPIPTFPRAQYIAQRADWEEATHPNERNRAGYYEEDLLPIRDNSQLEFVVGDTEIVQGVRCHLTGGHTAGHQIVLLEVDGQKCCFFGDLVPTVAHLPLAYSQGFDLFPLDVLNAKRELLAQAEREEWLVLFDHEVKTPVGRVKKDESGKYGFFPAEP